MKISSGVLHLAAAYIVSSDTLAPSLIRISIISRLLLSMARLSGREPLLSAELIIA